jgi:hypothetical protein
MYMYVYVNVRVCIVWFVIKKLDQIYGIFLPKYAEETSTYFLYIFILTSFNSLPRGVKF